MLSSAVFTLRTHESQSPGFSYSVLISLFMSFSRHGSNFLPDTGLLHHVRTPTGDNVRMETGFGTGDEISVRSSFIFETPFSSPFPIFQVFYDPLIAKLIVHGSDRTEALRVLCKALREYQVVGPHTNIAFLQRLAEHPAFVKGDVETGFIPASLSLSLIFFFRISAQWSLIKI